jgi:2',3'-cyclic-nucleotide 2'-phosphodiesterase (5'-nucleotidase family)
MVRLRPNLAPSVRPAIAVLLFALFAAGCSSGGRQSPAPPPAAAALERTAVLLTINDVYRIEGVDGGTVGGLSRLRTLRRELEREAPDLLLLHAGDLLYPSFASRMFNGEQMIAVLDALDGSSTAFDRRMFAVFGNHEFEKPRLQDAGILASRVRESQFRWLAGNVTFANGSDGRPLIGGENVAPTALVESGGIRIGLFGLTIPTPGVDYVADFEGPEAAARKLTAELRRQGAEVVVALTHLNAADDRELLADLGADGPDLIVGGHDHEAMALQVGDRWVFKADADARTANVLRLTLGADGRLRTARELVPLAGATPAPDPGVQALVDRWQARHEQAFCTNAGAGKACLGEVYGRTRTVLEAEESKVRSRETSLGDWVTDRMLAAFAPCGAQVAFLNSGSLRLNQDLPAGSTVTRRHVEELFAYPTPLYLIRLDGAALQKVAEHATRGWPGSGSWLQVAGWAYVHDQKAKSAHGLTLLGPTPRPVRPEETLLAVTGDYLIDPDEGDQDGYQMLSTDQIVQDCAANGQDLKDIVIRDLEAAEPQGIAPVTEGRICQPGTRCLAVGRRGGAGSP